ncbi:MAG: hypothetical protein ACLP01_18625 [Solirubrobacteraceae bacterium]
MSAQTGTGDGPPAVRRIIARVELQSRVLEQIHKRHEAGDDTAPQVLNVNKPSPERLNLYVSLSAHTTDEQRIRSDGSGFGMGGPRRGVGAIWWRYHGPPPLPDDPEGQNALLENHHVGPADIEDGINQMLGRDPSLHRPPRLSWGKLIATLAEHGIQVTEQDLINAPLTVELDPDVQADLENHQ